MEKFFLLYVRRKSSVVIRTTVPAGRIILLSIGRTKKAIAETYGPNHLRLSRTKFLRVLPQSVLFPNPPVLLVDATSSLLFIDGLTLEFQKIQGGWG
jgi:hypothetical protein